MSLNKCEYINCLQNNASSVVVIHILMYLLIILLVVRSPTDTSVHYTVSAQFDDKKCPNCYADMDKTLLEIPCYQLVTVSSIIGMYACVCDVTVFC